MLPYPHHAARRTPRFHPAPLAGCVRGPYPPVAARIVAIPVHVMIRSLYIPTTAARANHSPPHCEEDGWPRTPLPWRRARAAYAATPWQYVLPLCPFVLLFVLYTYPPRACLHALAQLERPNAATRAHLPLQARGRTSLPALYTSFPSCEILHLAGGYAVRQANNLFGASVMV